jgi:hypothetical protein
MDLKCFSISLMPMALQVQFVCRSKTELRNVIVRDRGERIYKKNLRSSFTLIIPKILNGNLWFFNLYLTEDYIEVLLFL